MSTPNQHAVQRGIKRLFDVVFSAVALIVLSPLLLAIYVAVKVSMGGPVLFRQDRGGYRGSIIQLIKFRTMSYARDADGNLLPDADRLTRVGHILRQWSLDELPQLWNVLRGDLSLVGPRPLFAKYLSRYSEEQKRRHLVRPGITGWAQVNGRNAITWEDRFKLDVWYVDHWSVALDLRILFMTITRVLARKGISEEGQATMTEFVGSRE
jgi:lipopolysaccharide/colanic/teichoic acid biosynthesis glycosyltransferase